MDGERTAGGDVGRRRAAAVLLAPWEQTGAPPPGVSARDWGRALTEDVVEVLGQLAGVEPAVGYPAGLVAEAADVAWPGTRRVPVPAVGGEGLLGLLAGLAAAGAEEGLVVAPDAPDVPPLVLAKLFSALTGAEVAVCPAAGDGLVALAARLPAPAWLVRVRVSLDEQDALPRLRAAAPARGLALGPGWHRLRRAGDVGRLDAGLEGWESTRALLEAGGPVRRGGGPDPGG